MMMKAMGTTHLQGAIHHQLKVSMQAAKHHIHSSMLPFTFINNALGIGHLISTIMFIFPSRFIDHETMSMQSTVSLGRVGRVLGGEMKLTSRSGSKESVSRATTPEVKTPDMKTPEVKTPTLVPEPVAAAVAAASNTAVVVVVNCTEPDIVASAKASIQTDQAEAAIVLDPVAPPRSRRRKPLAPNPPTMVSLPAAPASTIELPVVAVAASPNVPIAVVSPLPVSISAPSLCPPTTNSIPTLVAAAPPSPASSLEPGSKWTINSLTKGHQEHSLDLKSALKGNYVIKPQVFNNNNFIIL